MRPRRRDPPPILFLFLTKRERAVDGPREKIAFGRAPVQWPSARTGVSRIGAGKNCRPSADSRRTVLLSRPCAACSVRQSSGWKIAWPLLLNPLAAPWSREGRPAAAAAQPLAALPLTDAAYPLRVKSTLTVSGTSPGLDDPKGSAFPSLTAARDGQPSPAGGRRSACMRTDPPKHFFSSTGQLRSRWRLCRLTDAAYPLRVRRIFFLMSQTGAPAAPRAVGRGGAAEGVRPGPAGRGERSEACADDNGGCIAQPPTRLNSASNGTH